MTKLTTKDVLSHFPTWTLDKEVKGRDGSFTQYRRSMVCPDLGAVVRFPADPKEQPDETFLLRDDPRVFTSIEDAVAAFNRRRPR